MPKALNSAAIPAPKFRYSQIIQAGSHYYCSGLLGLDDYGNLVAGGPGMETAQILGYLPGLLESLQMSWDNLVFARVFCADFAKFAEVNAAWEAVFTEDTRPPARSAVGVASLPMGATVEIEFVLYEDS